jgi:GNAT superfamily N-acetyltransferase
VEIRPLDPHDSSVFERYAEVERRAMQHDNPYATPFAPQELLVLLGKPNPSERWLGYAGFEGGAMVVAGLAVYWLADNRDKVRVDVWVEPEHRGRGHGSAMAEFLVEQAAREGRTTLLTEITYPLDADETHPSRRFATKHGFTLANAEVHRILDIPVDESVLDGLIEAAAPSHRDYRIAEYAGAIPDELVPSYCELVNALLTDAPSGEVDFEAGALTPEMFLEHQASIREQGRTMYFSVATDSSGRAVAHNELVVPEHEPGRVFQWATLVHRDHRGHRLGLATKARNLKVVQAAHPDRRLVHTFNAASNSHMIAINERLGFRKVELAAQYQRIL